MAVNLETGGPLNEKFTGNATEVQNAIRDQVSNKLTKLNSSIGALDPYNVEIEVSKGDTLGAIAFGVNKAARRLNGVSFGINWGTKVRYIGSNGNVDEMKLAEANKLFPGDLVSFESGSGETVIVVNSGTAVESKSAVVGLKKKPKALPNTGIKLEAAKRSIQEVTPNKFVPGTDEFFGYYKIEQAEQSKFMDLFRELEEGKSYVNKEGLDEQGFWDEYANSGDPELLDRLREINGSFATAMALFDRVFTDKNNPVMKKYMEVFFWTSRTDIEYRYGDAKSVSDFTGLEMSVTNFEQNVENWLISFEGDVEKVDLLRNFALDMISAEEEKEMKANKKVIERWQKVVERCDRALD